MSIRNFAAMTVKDFLNLQKKNINIKELFDAYFHKYEKEIKWTNAILHKYDIENGKMPFGFKDNIYIRGEITTSGSKLLKNFHAPFDSTVYTLCKENNLQVILKANMDEFAMGSHNIYSAYGYVYNPINLKEKTFDLGKIPTKKEEILTPGGSSGGSGVVVSAGLCLGSFGTDTGGSVRGPAEWNGLMSMKPTFGNISRYGVVELSSSLDTVSLCAKTIECLKYFVNIFYKEDNKDSVNQVVLSNKPLKRKLGSIKNLAKNIITKEAYETLIDVENKLIAKGYIIEDVNISMDIIQCIDILYSVICYSDASSSLRVYNSLLYNTPQSTNTNIYNQMYSDCRTDGFGLAQVKRRMMIGNILTTSSYKSYINKAWKIIHLLYQELKHIFEYCDGIIAPVNGECPLLYNLNNSGSKGALTSDIWLCLSNLCGTPGVAISTHKFNNGIYGVQILGDIGMDLQILDIAQEIDDHYKFNQVLRGKFEYINDNKLDFINGDK